MKILVVGAGRVPAIERYYVDHLNELGVDTRLYDAQNIFFDYYWKSIFNKMLFKAGISPIYSRINAIFKRLVEEMSPDIIWVFKGMELFPESLQWAKDRKIKLVNYNTDNPFIFSGKGSGNRNVVDSLGLFDLHLTYDRSIRERIIQEYKIPCELLPFSFEADEKLFERCRAQAEEIRVCFLGSPDKDRAAFLEEIGREVPLTIYGPGWEKFIKSSSISVHGAVHNDEFWKTLYRYRVQINFMRPHNPDSHNMRSFEVPGTGGIMLAPSTTDHRAYFVENEEIFLFSSPGECVKKAKYLLHLSSDEAARIRGNARRRSIGSGYSYLGRARGVKKWFEDLL